MAAQVGASEVDTHGQASSRADRGQREQQTRPADKTHRINSRSTSNNAGQEDISGQPADTEVQAERTAVTSWQAALPEDHKTHMRDGRSLDNNTQGQEADTFGQADQPAAATHGQTNTPTDTHGQEARPVDDNKSEGDEAAALETALEQLGPFGPYQRYMLAMLCVPNVLAAMYSLNYVFVADLVPFRCVVPECEGLYPPYENEPAQALLPAAPCQRYSPHNSSLGSCDRDAYHNTTVACHLFVYENSDTTFAEFDLACREWLRTLVGTARSSALPLALLLTGYISDTYGRRTAFCLFSACVAVLGIVKALSVNYQMYLAFEFLEAALGYGFTSAAYVMTIELARPSLRAAFACATGVAYGVGGALFAWLAWRVRYWRHLLVAIHSLALLLPLYWLLVDESVRWLHVSGRRDRSVAAIRKAARWNKVILNDEAIKKLASEGSRAEESPPSAWLSLVRSRALAGRLALCAWCWVAVAFVYYGLTINSVALAGDKYVNFALNMAMEVVASLLIMMALERFGRKRSIFCAFLLCGVSCVIPFFVSHKRTGLGLFFVGKLSITFAFNSLYVFTAELFPTRVRSSALAGCSLVGRLGAVLAPQTPLLSAYVQASLYGACSLSAACSVLLVPETRRSRLPHDMPATERVHRPSATPRPAPAAPRVLSAHT